MFKSLKRMLHTLMWGTEGKPGQPEPQPVAPIKPDPNPWDGKSFFQWNQEVIREARAKGLSFYNGSAYEYITHQLKLHPDYGQVFADKYKYSSTPPSPHIPKSKLDDIIWIEKMKAYEQFIPEDVRAVAMAKRTESMWKESLEGQYRAPQAEKADPPKGSVYFCRQCGKDVTHLADWDNNLVEQFCSTDCSDKYHGWTT
jgi:hypothetical protein